MSRGIPCPMTYDPTPTLMEAMMYRIEKVFKKLRSSSWCDQMCVTAMEHYLATGNKSLLLKSYDARYIWAQFESILPAPANMDEIDHRIVQGMIYSECWNGLGIWLSKQLNAEKPEDDSFSIIMPDLIQVSKVEKSLIGIISFYGNKLARDGQPNSLGRYVLSLSDDKFRSLLIRVEYMAHQKDLLEFLYNFSPDRARRFALELIRQQDMETSIYLYELLLQVDRKTFEPEAVRDFRGQKKGLLKPARQLSEYNRFTLGVMLTEYDFSSYSDETLQTARYILSTCASDSNPAHAAVWMMDNFPDEVFGDIVAYAARKMNGNSNWLRSVMPHAIGIYGRKAAAIAMAALDSQEFYARIQALDFLVNLDDGTNQQLIRQTIENGLEEKQAETVVNYLALADRLGVKIMEDNLWPLLQHKAKTVRDAAARILAGLGEEVIPKAVALLNHRKADIRLAAAVMLEEIDTPEALQSIELRLDIEEDDAVIEAILRAMQNSASGKGLTREQIERRIEANVSKIKWPPVEWAADLPIDDVYYKDGTHVPSDVFCYMIHRQSHFQEIAPFYELRPLYQMIDRSTSGDLALELLRSFISRGADTKYKWVLALAGLLGDDRVVAVLDSQIKTWADSSRGKLAEYAVQALALLGTDRALLALDSLSMRYRTKFRNIGAAAVEAFNAAAEAMGTTPEELGDKVVPWLGFEPGKPRIITCGDRRIEARIGLDLKLRYLDLDKNKPVSSLPSSASTEVKEEFKQLGALLREAVKAQLLRLESLMVRQHRWPAARWKELFLGHPVMIPFGVRLVWGAYDGQGNLISTFRALEDSTLTNNTDDSVDISDAVSIGILHPLELEPDEREAWIEHLSDYEIEPPFPQLERPVVTVLPEQAKDTFYKEVAGTSINGMTFKGRAERLGWRRGSVCDAGSITAYMKSFTTADVDAFIMLTDMFVGMDMYSEITLGNAFFVKCGDVKVGSYGYDEPNDEKDPRLIQFQQVPPIVYSEVIGDLQRIAKGRQAEEE